MFDPPARKQPKLRLRRPRWLLRSDSYDGRSRGLALWTVGFGITVIGILFDPDRMETPPTDASLTFPCVVSRAEVVRDARYEHPYHPLVEYSCNIGGVQSGPLLLFGAEKRFWKYRDALRAIGGIRAGTPLTAARVPGQDDRTWVTDRPPNPIPPDEGDKPSLLTFKILMFVAGAGFMLLGLQFLDYLSPKDFLERRPASSIALDGSREGIVRFGFALLRVALSATFTLAILTFIYLRLAYPHTGWLTVTGTVESLDRLPTGEFDLYFRYKAGGAERFGNRSLDAEEWDKLAEQTFPVGKQLSVSVNPVDPTDVAVRLSLDKATRTRFVVTLLLGLGLLLLSVRDVLAQAPQVLRRYRGKKLVGSVQRFSPKHALRWVEFRGPDVPPNFDDRPLSIEDVRRGPVERTWIRYFTAPAGTALAKALVALRRENLVQVDIPTRALAPEEQFLARLRLPRPGSLHSAVATVELHALTRPSWKKLRRTRSVLMSSIVWSHKGDGLPPVTELSHQFAPSDPLSIETPHTALRWQLRVEVRSGFLTIRRRQFFVRCPNLQRGLTNE